MRIQLPARLAYAITTNKADLYFLWIASHMDNCILHVLDNLFICVVVGKTKNVTYPKTWSKLNYDEMISSDSFFTQSCMYEYVYQ